MPHLTIQAGSVKQHGRPITELDLDVLARSGAPTLTLGRGPANDLVLETDLTVSRERHASLSRESQDFVLENHTDRAHRVRVNGEPLSRGTRRVLADGDEIVIGRSVWLRYRSSDPAHASTLDASGDAPALAAAAPHGAAAILGVSRAIRAVVEQIRIAAASDIAVLVLGETGVGKELVARAVHDASGRRGAPFVAVNTPALSAELFESELFGHDRGAFTGAATDKPGWVEAAAGGTLFLDEVGELPMALQPKLLRLLENRTFVRVGSTRERRSRARVVAATNRDLKSAVTDGRFRQDLYYRIAGFPIVVPPIRERRDDIPVLVRAALEDVARLDGRAVRFDPAALDALVQYDWPGNVRELKQTVRRLALSTRGGAIAKGELPSELRSGEAGFLDGFRERWQSRDFAERVTLVDLERATRALGSRSALARWLGERNRSTFYARIKRLGAERRAPAAGA